MSISPSSRSLLECIICLVEKPCTDFTAEEKCSHVFCNACLTDWHGRSLDCPMCRSDTKPSTLLLDRAISVEDYILDEDLPPELEDQIENQYGYLADQGIPAGQILPPNPQDVGPQLSQRTLIQRICNAIFSCNRNPS